MISPVYARVNVDSAMSPQIDLRNSDRENVSLSDTPP